MNTYQIKVSGQVQGVGFRPFVYRFFDQQQIGGRVFNTTDGVTILITTTKDPDILCQKLKQQSPPQAIIRSIEYTKRPGTILFREFRIEESEKLKYTALSLTPDLAACPKCLSEATQKKHRMYRYPFTTCTNCGPRISITRELPYDRENTSMQQFEMCPQCSLEYNNVSNRRFHSQTHSCPNCGIKLTLIEPNKIIEDFDDFTYLTHQWNKGKVIAIKHTGGYLLTCDANNSSAIQKLRKLKHRPSKPFALLYHNIYELAEDVEMDIAEKVELESAAAPVVILSLKPDRLTPLQVHQISPGLHTIGVMLPSTPLLSLLLNEFNRPIVATSANVSGTPIIYADQYNVLLRVSDIVLTHNRNIVQPQDDSVVQYSPIKYYRTVIRRARGIAPSFPTLGLNTLAKQDALAMGALLKSTFSIWANRTIHISQHIGNTIDFQTQQNYQSCLENYLHLLRPKINTILVDAHPDYFSTQLGKEISGKQKTKIVKVQHHKAHFLSVLGENNLLESDKRILGVIWDGTGLGDDGNIWGGEFLLYHNNNVKRIDHIPDYPHILGDKMVKEPRISALCILFGQQSNRSFVRSKFTNTEWQIYLQLCSSTKLKSTSVGRLFDAMASIILDIDKQSYEGEAASLLESAAHRYFRRNNFTLQYSYITHSLRKNLLQKIIEGVLEDISKKFDRSFIAAKFHVSLAYYILITAQKHKISHIAFSGGVFQNVWLIELILALMKKDYSLYFHRELSPNDENISYGQLMYYLHINN